MRSAAEEFAIQLGRASKRSLRFLRWTPTQDRDDVIATAMLSAWEARGGYDSTKQSLDDWFGEHLKVAVNDGKRAGYRRQGEVSLESMLERPSPEDTEREIATLQAAEAAYSALDPTEQEIVAGLAQGENMRELRKIAASGTTRRMFNKLRRLSELLPDLPAPRSVRRASAGESDDGADKLAAIDHEIERMLRRPATERADCPVCWRCCWFEGLTPKNYHAPKHIVEPDVLQAVRDTEARKIKIANGERK